MIERRRLHFIETKEMQASCEIPTSCGVLHNIYNNQGDYGQEFLEDVQENINVINVRDNDDTGGAKRDRIARSWR